MVEHYQFEIREGKLSYETVQYQIANYIVKSDVDTEYELIRVKEVYDVFKIHSVTYINIVLQII